MQNYPTRAEMIAAMSDPEHTSELAAKIGDFIISYGALLNEQAKLIEAIPQLIVLPAPRSNIEAFALELFTQEITAMGVGVEVKTDS